ncbi:uncharacterized protein LOC112993043 [Dromaius novaehollandiae]|uniref:uncharacterized protein LOC112993043 n=1 Tax=Dromaius novaehollandiae TaxID=8790 RepID=UPI000E1F422F|nr:uncharacterized protein LOC112993043 [Dromaius novaehollandiae]
MSWARWTSLPEGWPNRSASSPGPAGSPAGGGGGSVRGWWLWSCGPAAAAGAPRHDPRSRGGEVGRRHPPAAAAPGRNNSELPGRGRVGEPSAEVPANLSGAHCERGLDRGPEPGAEPAAGQLSPPVLGEVVPVQGSLAACQRLSHVQEQIVKYLREKLPGAVGGTGNHFCFVPLCREPFQAGLVLGRGVRRDFSTAEANCQQSDVVRTHVAHAVLVVIYGGMVLHAPREQLLTRVKRDVVGNILWLY